MSENGSDRNEDRRRNEGEFRVRPPRSPANLLILVVAGVLTATAAATVLGGGGLEDETPHGQLLTALREVAERQASHREAAGEFAAWLRTLDLSAPEGIDLNVVAGDAKRWEAVARHPVGLMCTQTGRWEGGRAVTEEPICYVNRSR